MQVSLSVSPVLAYLSLQLLLREDISCLAVEALPGTQTTSPFLGLFDVRVYSS